MLLMFYAVNKTKTRSGDKWYLNSDCSNHMSGNKLLFSDLDQTYQENVKLGKNINICVIGNDNVKI